MLHSKFAIKCWANSMQQVATSIEHRVEVARQAARQMLARQMLAGPNIKLTSFTKEAEAS